MARRTQIEFKGKQGHDKTVEKAVIALTVVCIIFVIIAIQVVGGGTPPP